MNLKGLPGGQYQPLSEKDIQTVHEAALAILEKTGFTYESGLDDTLAMLEAAGAQIDRSAARIRREAARHGVPIIEHRPLARALHRQCKVGAYIPAQLFDEVVGVLVQAYWRRGRFPTFLSKKAAA